MRGVPTTKDHRPVTSNQNHPSSPSPGDQTSELRGSQGRAPCRGSRRGSFLPLLASGGSRRPSLGWWPPPSRLCLRLHVASPLCPCISSSVSYKDSVLGFRATPIQEDLFSYLHSIMSAETLIPHKVPFAGSSPLISWGSCLGHV